MEKLKEKLKGEIIEVLNLEDISPEDIGDDQNLFDSDLGLDSIDALELIVLLDKEYNIKIVNQEEGKSVFTTVNSIAEFIKSKE